MYGWYVYPQKTWFWQSFQTDRQVQTHRQVKILRWYLRMICVSTAELILTIVRNWWASTKCSASKKFVVAAWQTLGYNPGSCSVAIKTPDLILTVVRNWWASTNWSASKHSAATWQSLDYNPGSCSVEIKTPDLILRVARNWWTSTNWSASKNSAATWQSLCTIPHHVV